MFIPSQAQSWLPLHEWVFPHGIGPGLWIQLRCSSLSDIGCRLLDRNGGRRRYSSKRPAGEIICGSNSDPYFRRSTGFVRPHCVPHPHFLIVNEPTFGYLLSDIHIINQSVSFSPMHFTLCKLNQLSFWAILPTQMISLSAFWTTFEVFTRIWHWVLGTAKTQFLPL